MSLLERAKDSYETARLQLNHYVNASIASEANRRFVEYRFSQKGGSGLGVVISDGKRYTPKPEDFIHPYPSDTYRTISLVRRRPEWWSEIVHSDGEIVEARVSRPGEIKWSYDANDSERPAMLVEDRPTNERPGLKFSSLLDPTEEYFWYALWDDADVSFTGERVVFAGRETLGVQVKTVSWRYAPRLFEEFDAGTEGTTDHQLLVDERTGAILRMSARLDGREYRVVEAISASLDVDVSEEEFVNPLPEVEWRRWGEEI